MTDWYISFATDEGFRGATVVEGENAEDALNKATILGLNPGGEALIFEVPEERCNHPDHLAMKNHLLNRAQMRALSEGSTRLGDLPEETQDFIDEVAAKVCDDCNKT